jgi:hypothetical protein
MCPFLNIDPCLAETTSTPTSAWLLVQQLLLLLLLVCGDNGDDDKSDDDTMGDIPNSKIHKKDEILVM